MRWNSAHPSPLQSIAKYSSSGIHFGQLRVHFFHLWFCGSLGVGEGSVAEELIRKLEWKGTLLQEYFPFLENSRRRKRRDKNWTKGTSVSSTVRVDFGSTFGTGNEKPVSDMTNHLNLQEVSHRLDSLCAGHLLTIAVVVDQLQFGKLGRWRCHVLHSGQRVPAQQFPPSVQRRETEELSNRDTLQLPFTPPLSHSHFPLQQRDNPCVHPPRGSTGCHSQSPLTP